MKEMSMTAIFCKDCDYFKQGTDFEPWGCYPDTCMHEPVDDRDPVRGIVYRYWTCKSKNEFCNCTHFKPKPTSFFGKLNKVVSELFD